LLLVQEISSKTPALVAAFIDPAQIYALDVAEPPAPLILLFLSSRDQAYPIPSSKSLIRSQLLTPVTYNETVAIAGWLGRNCWIGWQRRYDEAVFDGIPARM
jgi:hypothetical protein